MTKTAWDDVDNTGILLHKALKHAANALWQTKEANEIAQLCNAMAGLARTKNDLAKVSDNEQRLTAIEQLLKTAKGNVITV